MPIELHFKILGSLLLLLAAAHVLLPRQLNWREELGRLSLVNRQIFVVHVVFICFVLIGCGLLFTVFTGPMLEPTALSRLVLIGLAVFWGMRLLVQLFFYDRRLWWGDRPRTVAHVVFSMLWAWLAGTLVWALVSGAS